MTEEVAGGVGVGERNGHVEGRGREGNKGQRGSGWEEGGRKTKRGAVVGIGRGEKRGKNWGKCGGSGERKGGEREGGRREEGGGGEEGHG